MVIVSISSNHSQENSYKHNIHLILDCDQNLMSSGSGQHISTRQILGHFFNACPASIKPLGQSGGPKGGGHNDKRHLMSRISGRAKTFLWTFGENEPCYSELWLSFFKSTWCFILSSNLKNPFTNQRVWVRGDMCAWRCKITGRCPHCLPFGRDIPSVDSPHTLSLTRLWCFL